MRTPLIPLLMVSALVLAAASLLTAEEPAQTPVEFSADQIEFFEQQVLPVLQSRCFKCHGGQPKLEGGLRLTSREGILKGGELGASVEPGQPEASQLVDAVNYNGLEMPPGGKIPQAEIDVLVKWVKLGLPWSGKKEYGVEEHVEADARGDGRDYWAYQQITRPEVPVVTNTGWVTSPIDAFVLRKLEAAGLQPVKPADKVALIRRAYYDLIGLPPSPDDVDRFLNDDSPEAFARVVDHLLEQPQYGERWGRHWLDLVRYAETHGYERDSPKPEAWRYRDYVIESLNADKPYDQFVIEQIAGDELPEVTQASLTATGIYRLGLWDDEPADPELAHYDGLDDITKTFAESVLGISMGCARCHSHKVDPLNHDEYYGFLAYFHDINYPIRGRDPNLILRRWETPESLAQHELDVRRKQQREADLEQSIRAIEDSFRLKIQAELGAAAVADSGTEGSITVLMADSREQRQNWEYTFEKPSDDWKETDYATTSWDKGPGGFGTPGTPGAVVGTTWSTPDIWLRRWFTLEEIPAGLQLDLHHDEDCEIFINGTQIYSAKGYVVQYERVSLKPAALKALRKGENVIAIHCHQTGGGQYIDAGLLTGSGRLDFESALKQYGRRLLGQESFDRLQTLRRDLEDSRKRQLPPPGVPILSISESGRTPVHVLARGIPQAKGKVVAPMVPAMLGIDGPELPEIPESAPSSGKRLAIAQWMFQSDNPLTARVIANRLWQHHFGRGIVATPNDFGKLGDRPTHPELLDWLASEIREGGWKLKRMHRLIMLSSTYRLSVQNDVAAFEKDPGNQLMWRANIRRLSAEEVRDSMLAATGELNLKRGGPSIYVPIPAAVLAGQSRPGAGWGNSPPEEASRRSVYIHVKRSLLVPILEMHDQADTDSSCPVRYVTTVPTQSLGMLNGEFTNERARQFAARLRREVPGDLKGQVIRAIRLTTGRQPSPAEVASDMSFVESIQADEKLSTEQALVAYCLLALNTNEFIYLD